MDRDADVPSTIVVADLFWLAPILDFATERPAISPAQTMLAPTCLALRSGRGLRTYLQSLTC